MLINIKLQNSKLRFSPNLKGKNIQKYDPSYFCIRVRYIAAKFEGIYDLKRSP